MGVTYSSVSLSDTPETFGSSLHSHCTKVSKVSGV